MDRTYFWGGGAWWGKEELVLQGGVGGGCERSGGRFVPSVYEGGIEEVIGVYQGYKAGVDAGGFVGVEGSGEVGGFLEGEWFVPEDCKGSFWE